jgi:putative endonuclease
MFYTYVIKSTTSGKIYTGHTNNIEKRILRHNKILPSKKSSYTSKQGEEWVLVYKETLESRSGAIKREKELKSGKGREFLKNCL